MMSLTLVVVLNWKQFLALFGLGSEAPRFELIWREPALSWGMCFRSLAAVMLLEVIPYIEELIRGLRANHGKLVPKEKPDRMARS